MVPSALRLVGVDVEIHDETYDPQTSIEDPRWIRHATSQGRIIVKRDRRIQYNPAEKATFVECQARAFLLDGNAGKFEMLRTLFLAWSKMQAIVDQESGPYIYAINAKGQLIKRYPKD